MTIQHFKDSECTDDLGDAVSSLISECKPFRDEKEGTDLGFWHSCGGMSLTGSVTVVALSLMASVYNWSPVSIQT